MFKWAEKDDICFRTQLKNKYHHHFSGDIIIVNVHTPSEDKDKMKSFYRELERVFDQFSRYHTKMLLGHFNAKNGLGDIFKPTTGSESLH